MGATKMLEDFLEVIDVEVSPREIEWVDNEDGGEWVETKPAEYRSQTVLREPNKDTKSQSDLERVINLGKPQVVVDRIRELVNLTNQWNWCYDYIYYLNDMEDWENWETEVTYDDDGVELYRTEKPEEPIEPLRPADIVDSYARELFKRDREVAVSSITVEVDDLVFDGDELSQGRMTRAIVSLEQDEEMPWTLADNTIVSVTKDTLQKALKLAGARQSELWIDVQV